MKRVFWIIADSLGVGALPDADRFGDEGAHTLGSILNATGGLKAPMLQRLGLANIVGHPLWPSVENPLASFGKMNEQSPGKDTTTGHWEMAGVPLDHAFPLFPNGFPADVIQEFCRRLGVAGVLGNKPASGTEIIKELGEEHVRTGKPIVYTSGDSVFQIAAHEESFGLQRLYDACKIARELCDVLQVGRIIARPFIGNARDTFTRTTNRHDYSVEPPQPTVLEHVKEHKHQVFGLGKIPDIFAHRGFTQEVPSTTNTDGMNKMCTLAAKTDWSGVAMVNLVDFDTLYGHRRDPKGYRKALEIFDQDLQRFVPVLGENDVMIISADHGCDPTFRGSDHTREYVPLLSYQPGRPARPLGVRRSFADVAVSISHFLELPSRFSGESFL